MKTNPNSLERQRGAAILLAMLIMTLVATLAAGMVWLQWRGIEVESAERARGEGEWLLNGALDWGNLILKSSVRNGPHQEDDLTQPWATPLAETKLSSFLSADGSHSDDSGPEAFLSGQITDAQSRYNLYNLFIDDTQGKNKEIQRLQILCDAVGVSRDVAITIASGMAMSWSAQVQLVADPTQKDSTNSVLMPRETSDLTWYGIDPAVVKQLAPYVEIIPLATGDKMTPINVNTASPEVLMAAIPGIGMANAQQLIQRRQQKPLTSDKDAYIAAGLPATGPPPSTTGGPGPNIAESSSYFEVYGQLRYEQHVLRERSVVHRVNPSQVDVIRRERLPPDGS